MPAKKEDSSEKNNVAYLTFKIRKLQLIIFLGFFLILIAALIYYFKDRFIVASVNGQLITRDVFTRELEQRGGKQTLDVLITQALILQEAKKKNISISDSEIKSEIKKIEESFTAQGQSLEQMMQSQGITKQSFEEQVKIQIMVEKLLAPEMQITDKEVGEFIEKNKSFLPPSSDEAKLKEQATDQLKQQKLREKYQSWRDTLQKKAKITYYLKY